VGLARHPACVQASILPVPRRATSVTSTSLSHLAITVNRVATIKSFTPRAQAEHTPRHQTAVFRSGETRPEAESKRALFSDKPGALPPETGFPLNNVRGQADPYTQHKRDGVPPWKETKAVAMGAWSLRTLWKRRIGPGGEHGGH